MLFLPPINKKWYLPPSGVAWKRAGSNDRRHSTLSRAIRGDRLQQDALPLVSIKWLLPPSGVDWSKEGVGRATEKRIDSTRRLMTRKKEVWFVVMALGSLVGLRRMMEMGWMMEWVGKVWYVD